MDISRMMLDNLMGRDRNLPKNSIHNRDHYSNSDVCKPYLVCFCFNTLFPNTIYDEGPCNKRHDTYLKTMFDNDLNRGEYEKNYIKQCINWIQRRLQEAQQKTKKNQNTIENKTSLSTQRPRQILDRILAIDKDIEEMMKKAEIFGQNGQIDDSARCLEQVQRLRERRKQIDLMGDNLLAVVKQQKICQICGAIQTINDTQKRIQMHLQGKIHQGFLKLRTQIETLKIRLEIIQQKIDKNRQKNQAIMPSNANSNMSQSHSQNRHRDTDKNQEKQRQRERQRQQRQKQRQKEKQRQKQKQREREREREKEREREREKQREKARDLQRQKLGHKDRQRDESHHSKKKKKQHKHKDEKRDSRERKKEDRPSDKKDLQGQKKKDKHDRDDREKKSKKKRDYSRSPQKQYKRQRERSRQKDYRYY